MDYTLAERIKLARFGVRRTASSTYTIFKIA